MHNVSTSFDSTEELLDHLKMSFKATERVRKDEAVNHHLAFGGNVRQAVDKKQVVSPAIINPEYQTAGSISAVTISWSRKPRPSNLDNNASCKVID
jgi:hypothetical protein